MAGRPGLWPSPGSGSPWSSARWPASRAPATSPRCTSWSPARRQRPEATKAALKRFQDWLLGHARQLIAYTALILGAYLAISGLVCLS